MKGRNQLLVGFSGSFENLTVVQGPGEDIYIKGKITQMTNPRTPEQTKGRDRFKNCTGRASALRPFLNDHFARISDKASPYASFISRNMNRVDPQGIADLALETQYDYYTWGDLPKIPLTLDAVNSAPDGPDDYALVVNFSSQVSAQNQQASDWVHVLVFNDESFDWTVQATQYTRGMGTVEATVGRPVSGLNLVIPFLISQDGQLVETRTPFAYLDSSNTLTLIS